MTSTSNHFNLTRMADCVVTHSWLLLKEHFVCVLLCSSAVLARGSSHKWSGASRLKGPLCSSADVTVAWLMQTYTHSFVRKYRPESLLHQIYLVHFNLKSAINMDLRNIYWQLWEIITSENMGCLPPQPENSFESNFCIEILIQNFKLAVSW